MSSSVERRKVTLYRRKTPRASGGFVWVASLRCFHSCILEPSNVVRITFRAREFPHSSHQKYAADKEKDLKRMALIDRFY
jgi:hypothetical protein